MPRNAVRVQKAPRPAATAAGRCEITAFMVVPFVVDGLATRSRAGGATPGMGAFRETSNDERGFRQPAGDLSSGCLPGSRLGVGLVEGYRRLHQGLECRGVYLLALGDIDGTAHVAVEACVEKLGRVGQRSAFGEGQLHLVLVGLTSADYPAEGPDGCTHPLPFLHHIGRRLVNQLAHPGQGLPAPVAEVFNPLVNQLRCCRGIDRNWLFHDASSQTTLSDGVAITHPDDTYARHALRVPRARNTPY